MKPARALAIRKRDTSPLVATAKPITAPGIDRTTPLEQLPNLLRVPECARWADVSKGAIYEAIRHGQLAHVRLGRLLRVPRSALAAWLGQ